MHSVTSTSGVEVSVFIALGSRIHYLTVKFADRKETWFEFEDAHLLASALRSCGDQSGTDYMVRGSVGTVRVSSGDVEGEPLVTVEWSPEVDDLVDLRPSEAYVLAGIIADMATSRA